jgi:hypothetical protein
MCAMVGHPYRGLNVGRSGFELAYGVGFVFVSLAAIAETLNALGVLNNGSEPGADYALRTLLIAGSVLACVSVALCGPLIALSERVASCARSPAVTAFMLAAAALVVSHFYAYDAYYAPSRISFGDEHTFSTGFVLMAVGLDVAASALIYRRVRLGFALQLPALLLSAFFVFAAGVGH